MRACVHLCAHMPGPRYACVWGGSDHLRSAAWELLGLSWDKALSGLFIFPQLPVLPLPDGDSPMASWDSGVGGPGARLTSGRTVLGPGGLGSPTRQRQSGSRAAGGD